MIENEEKIEKWEYRRDFKFSGWNDEKVKR